MKKNNLHAKELFERAYGDRDWNWYRHLIAECIRYGMPGKWLDLGAGLGLFVECAQRFGIDCVGLEGSEYGVKAAKERFPNIYIKHHFLEDSFPFEDESISTVVIHQTIEHVRSDTAIFMLRESFRVLKPGGVIFIYSPCKFDKEQRSEETHINLYTPSSLRKKVESIGFGVSKVNNSPRMIFGNSQVVRYVMRIMLRLFPLDFLSATANCIAIKPE